MKRYFLIVLYNIAAIILLFLLFEGAVRIFVPEINLSGTSANLVVDSLYKDSPGIRSDTIGTSGSVEKSTNDYHSWKYYKPVNSSVRKLLYLGDSVTMGISVENDSTYAGIINNNADSMRVVNPSLIGYSSKDYLNVFNSFVEQNRFNLKFTSVVLFWTLNDIYSNYPDENQPGFSGGGFLDSIVNFFRHNSKAYHFLRNLFSDRSAAYYKYDRQFYSADDPLLKSSVKNIEEISSACDSLGIKLEVALLPYEYQVRNYNESRPAGSVTGIFYPQELMKEKLRGLNITLTDLREAFKNDYKDSRSYYLYGDGIHFNNKGHRLIAEYLLKSPGTPPVSGQAVKSRGLARFWFQQINQL